MGVLRQLSWGLLLSVVVVDGYAGAVGFYMIGAEFEAAD
jgi:hypothetical protein